MGVVFGLIVGVGLAVGVGVGVLIGAGVGGGVGTAMDDGTVGALVFSWVKKGTKLTAPRLDADLWSHIVWLIAS